MKLYPPTVITYNDPSDGITPVEIPCTSYLEAVANQKVGDIIRHYAGAPGTGYVDYRITRIDKTGVYASIVRNTMRELQAWEVR